MVKILSNIAEEIAQTLSAAKDLKVPREYLDAVKRRVLNAPEHTEGLTKYRASSLGRPFVLHMLERWYGGRRAYSAGQAIPILMGSIFQEFMTYNLELMGLDIETEALLVDEKLNISGHADFVIKKDREVFVGEIKNMASFALKKFRELPTDDYGYISQLAFYYNRLCAKYPDCQVTAAFVLFDGGTRNYYVVPMSRETLIQKVERYQNGLPILDSIEDYDLVGLFDKIQIPPVVNDKPPPVIVNTRWCQHLYANTSAGWKVRPTKQVIAQLEMLGQERADGQELI